MPGFNGPEINRIREYMFDKGEGVRILFGGSLGPPLIAPDRWYSLYDHTEVTQKEADHAFKVLGLIEDSNACF